MFREYAVSVGSSRGFIRQHHAFMYFDHMIDPVITDPSLYHVVWENDRVRILEYVDGSGRRNARSYTPPQRDGDTFCVGACVPLAVAT